MLPLYILVFAVLLGVLKSPKHSNNVFSGSRVLLLTAHPDDECLFFAPTVLALADDAQVYSLTLSVGNADGLGQVRKQELQGSLDILGIIPGRRWTVDHDQLQDNITQHWDAEVIASTIRPYVLQHQIDIILTFDHDGVSSHPNHKSLPSGTKELIQNLTSVAPPRLFTLITVPVLTKYNSILSPLLAKMDLSVSRAMYYLVITISNLLQHTFHIPITSEPDYAVDVEKTHAIMPVFVSGVNEYWQAVQAMRAHASQLVWFRYLYVSFSRYMWVNEWVEVKVPPP
ncbi:hypothetical protein M378DRAFT_133511 [Amanita muscaria Koide BX008]|uniref:N-acetylglucosaminylphosphatidylinositol deacetylase n=1 Tax=Amanita muscaria (strain Koide BX008) TaxID=946122 RepID=A0A0C2WLN0_AMAMK|nr:hypothetical protein M378DRAFT_133511 [Amanita muscaria Koide BX008]